MANLSKTRTVFAFTSPRTIEKIIPEIHVLVDSFSGQKWNTDTQIAFFRKLFDSPFYEGDKMPGNVSLAARDRITRAPKALGFVDLQPVIAITEAGSKLLEGKRLHEIFAKQLLKFQLPSPYHKIPGERGFNVRPYLELLRLIKEIGNLSKTEIAIFFVQITHYNKFDSIVKAIRNFRAEAKQFKGNRKAFIESRFNEEILKIYSEEIRNNKLGTRESKDTTLAKFIKTKRSNHIDYADAFIRYLRATQLISFDKNFRIVLSQSRIEEVDFILKHIDREAISYKSEQDFKKYLFSSSSLNLLTDDRNYLERRLAAISVVFNKKASINELKDLLDISEQKVISEVITKEELSLKGYKEFDSIVDIFEKIAKKDIPDPPLYLEWNVWRSLVMINYAKRITGNFSYDLDGVPLSTAKGNVPDIEIEYDGFRMIVEVTTSSGNTQFNMEGESVARHCGNLQKKSNTPVYCLFVAPKISEGALAHFFNLNRMNTKAYGGKTRIIPISMKQFVVFIATARAKKFNNAIALKSYFDSLINLNQVADDETMWYEMIGNSLSEWIN